MTTAGLAGAVPHVYLKFDGQDAPVEVMRQLREVSVESSLHLPDVATVLIRDPELKLVDDDTFSLGRSLRVSVQVADRQGELFDGEIVEVEARFEQHDQFLLLRAFDRLHRLGRGTHTRSFQNVSDMDLVRKIASEMGLQARTGPDRFVHEYVFQNNQTNLEFLQERAAALGYLLYVDGRTLHCEPPASQERAVRLKWGEGLSEFVPRLSSLGQPVKTVARGWDPQVKQPVVGQASRAQGAPQTGERRHSENAAAPFDVNPVHTFTGRVLRQQGVADAYAQAQADRAAQRLIEARGRCGGNPRVTAGQPVQIEAVGDRFGGVYYVTSASHHYRAGRGYHTEFHVSGQHPAGLAAMLSRKAGPAQRGLLIGLVTNNQDPQGQGRVKVKYPGLSDEHESHWARVVSAGGGKSRGTLHLPEVDDEVLIGFELGDIHHPYVLGGLHNGVDMPPDPPGGLVRNGQVLRRVTRSREGHWFILDDTPGKAAVQLRSAAGHTVELHDEGGQEFILIQDLAGNHLKLDTARGALNIQVQGDARVQAGGNVQVQAGQNMDLTAAGTFKVQATTVEVNGSALVNITGGLIKLN